MDCIAAMPPAQGSRLNAVMMNAENAKNSPAITPEPRAARKVSRNIRLSILFASTPELHPRARQTACMAKRRTRRVRPDTPCSNFAIRVQWAAGKLLWLFTAGARPWVPCRRHAQRQSSR